MVLLESYIGVLRSMICYENTHLTMFFNRQGGILPVSIVGHLHGQCTDDTRHLHHLLYSIEHILGQQFQHDSSWLLFVRLESHQIQPQEDSYNMDSLNNKL